MLYQYFPCDAAPRRATEDELGALYDYFGITYEVPRGDAQGIVEAMTVAVYDDCNALADKPEKTIVALAGGEPNEVYVFAVQKGELSLARTYREVAE